VGRLESTIEARETRLRALLIAAQGGDAAAYAEFLQVLSSHLRAFFRRRLAKWPEDVEDLLQETLLAVHNKRHTYEADQPVTAWLHAIARYKLVDLFRARAHHEALQDPLDEDTLLADSDTEAAEARRDLRRLLSELPDKQRLPIEYVKIEGLSVARAAELTGLSPSAVKVGVHRGLKVLAARIRGERTD
jgi:RNA polymerase sigma-70 factor, ECF subfamily